jgi:hypothetical protein
MALLCLLFGHLGDSLIFTVGWLVVPLGLLAIVLAVCRLARLLPPSQSP